MKACLLFFFWLGFLQIAFAQEPTYMEAATHPAKGNHYTRILFADDAWLLKHAVGLTSSRALLFDLETDADAVTDADLRLKLQILKWDTGPIDTWRASLVGGASWRDAGKPHARLGVVSTLIRGRHGLNTQADLNLAEEERERGQLNGSYVFRIHPVRYGPESSAAWYLMTEVLNTVSTDWELDTDFAGGLLYEARRWALELSYRQARKEEFLGVGARWLW